MLSRYVRISVINQSIQFSSCVNRKLDNKNVLNNDPHNQTVEMIEPRIWKNYHYRHNDNNANALVNIYQNEIHYRINIALGPEFIGEPA